MLGQEECLASLLKVSLVKSIKFFVRNFCRLASFSFWWLALKGCFARTYLGCSTLTIFQPLPKLWVSLHRVEDLCFGFAVHLTEDCFTATSRDRVKCCEELGTTNIFYDLL